LIEYFSTKLHIGVHIFYWIGNHIESNIRVFAALKWPNKLNGWKFEGEGGTCPIAGDADVIICKCTSILYLAQGRCIQITRSPAVAEIADRTVLENVGARSSDRS